MKGTKTSIAAVLIAASALSVPYGARAETVEKPILVQVGDDQGTVVFNAEPFLKQDTTMVQFRPIFEKLGLKVDWDEATSTVTGTDAKTEIKLQIGSKVATVNGKQVELAVAPEIVGDYTFVPLRFVGESTGWDVNWDGYANSVLIAPVEKQVESVLHKVMDYTNKENLEGYMSLLVKGSPGYEETRKTMASLFQSLDLQTEAKKVELVRNRDGELAIARAAVESHRTGGAAYRQRTQTSLYVLHKVDGSWKLAQVLPDKIDFMIADQYEDQKPVVSDSTAVALQSAVENLRALKAKGDFDGVAAQLDSSFSNPSSYIRGVKQQAAAPGYKLENGDFRIIQSAEGTYTVRYTETFTPPETSGTAGTKTDVAEKWKQNAQGKWVLLDSEAISIVYVYPG